MIVTEAGNGGQDRNRTGVNGFAVRCITTLPPGRKKQIRAFLVATCVGNKTYEAGPNIMPLHRCVESVSNSVSDVRSGQAAAMYRKQRID